MVDFFLVGKLKRNNIYLYFLKRYCYNYYVLWSFLGDSL